MGKWRENLIKITPYVAGEQSKDKDIVKLNANENPYPPSPQAEKILKSYQSGELRKYPNADATPLKEALAERFKLSPDNFFIGNGSDDVLALSFMAFFNSEKPILYPDITYSFYPVWCSLFKIKYENIPLKADFSIDISDYSKENGGIVIPNPNAPTSIGLTESQIRTLLDNNQDSVVIIDEAYVDFGGESVVKLISEYENLLVVQTFSKSRSLAGERIGYAIGNTELINALNAVKNSYNSYTVDSLSISLGVASVKDEEYFNETVNKIIDTRERLSKELKALGFDVMPSQTNFLFVTHKSASAREIFEYLKTRKVFVRYFALPKIDNYLRITVGTDKETDILLSEIRRFFDEKQA